MQTIYYPHFTTKIQPVQTFNGPMFFTEEQATLYAQKYAADKDYSYTILDDQIFDSPKDYEEYWQQVHEELNNLMTQMQDDYSIPSTECCTQEELDELEEIYSREQQEAEEREYYESLAKEE